MNEVRRLCYSTGTESLQHNVSLNESRNKNFVKGEQESQTAPLPTANHHCEWGQAALSPDRTISAQRHLQWESRDKLRQGGDRSHSLSLCQQRPATVNEVRRLRHLPKLISTKLLHFNNQNNRKAQFQQQEKNYAKGEQESQPDPPPTAIRHYEWGSADYSPNQTSSAQSILHFNDQNKGILCLSPPTWQSVQKTTRGDPKCQGGAGVRVTAYPSNNSDPPLVIILEWLAN